jgi:hypothetical protein
VASGKDDGLSPGLARQATRDPLALTLRDMSATVWRAKVHSERDDLRDDTLRDAAREYCRRAGVVGVGWGRPDITARDGAPLEDVLREIYSKDGWKAGATRFGGSPRMPPKATLSGQGTAQAPTGWGRSTGRGISTALTRQRAGISTTCAVAYGSTNPSETTRYRAQS